MVRHLLSSLTETLSVFDEPTIGLHPHNAQRLNKILTRLRDAGNTVLLMEHEPEVMAIADHIVDMGPAPEGPAERLCSKVRSKSLKRAAR